MSDGQEFNCSWVRQFEASNKKLYEKASLMPSSLLPNTNNDEWMVMPMKPEQKLSNLSAEEECTQGLKAF